MMDIKKTLQNQILEKHFKIGYGAKVAFMPRGNNLIWLKWQKGYPDKDFTGLGRN